MRLSRNKKASSTYPTLIALAGLLALASCWFILLDKSANFETKVGENQFQLVQQYQEGENYLFYIDMAADYSARQAVSALAAGGGYAAGSECGEVDGYTLWLLNGLDCYPTANGLQQSFEEEFGKQINKYSHLAYLPESDTMVYQMEYSEDGSYFIARPERYTDFITKIMLQDSEVPPGATVTKLGSKKISVHFAELGETIEYDAISEEEGTSE